MLFCLAAKQKPFTGTRSQVSGQQGGCTIQMLQSTNVQEALHFNCVLD